MTSLIIGILLYVICACCTFYCSLLIDPVQQVSQQLKETSMSKFVNSTSSSSFQHEVQFHHISNTTGRAHPFADNQHLQDLWNGEQLPNDATRRIPSTVDVVITFCRTDFTSYLDDFDNFLPPEVQRIEFKVFSKCGNEDMIRTKLNEKLKAGLAHNITFTIESVVNKGGCDLSIVHYINQFFQNTRSYNVAKDKVIFFLKDGNRTVLIFMQVMATGEILLRCGISHCTVVSFVV